MKMSNQITIMPTKFVNLDGSGESIGVRVYDEYGQTYDNTWEDMPTDPMKILARVMEIGDDISSGMIGHVQEMGKSVTIGSDYFEWNEIKHLFEKV
jgi:hypothetical protein